MKVYLSSIKTHVKNCETCMIASSPVALCNAGFELFVYYIRNSPNNMSYVFEQVMNELAGEVVK